MKTLIILMGMLCSTLANAATIFPCDLALYRKADGQRVFQSSFFIRYNAYSTVHVSNPESSLRLLSIRMVEEDVNIGITADNLEARPIGGFFNGMGRFATFGDDKTLGTIECQAPLKKNFFFLTRDGAVFLDSDKNLYRHLTTPGSCITGDLESAASALQQHWYLPMTDLDHHWTLRAEKTGLTWDEIRKEGIDCWQDGDLPAPQCTSWRETGRTRYHLPFCR